MASIKYEKGFVYCPHCGARVDLVRGKGQCPTCLWEISEYIHGGIMIVVVE